MNIRTVIYVLMIAMSSAWAQEKDLKELYTNFTTSINSLLLTQKGSMEMSGFISYNYLKSEFEDGQERTQSITQIEPQFSYFFMDNISVGMVLSYTQNKTEYESQIIPGLFTQPGTVKLEQTLVGPIVKMYFGEEELRPFIFTDFLFLSGDSDGSEADFGAGVFYHVSGNFGLNLFAKYGILWQNDDLIKNQQRIFVGLGITNFIF